MKTKLELKFNRIELAIKSGAVPLVTKESKRIEGLITNASSFDQECYYYIGKALEKLGNKINSFERLSQSIIKEVRNRHLMRRRVSTTASLEFLAKPSESNGGWQPQSNKYDAEESLLLKEKISALASGDSKKKLILNQWSIGCTNDSDLSSMLAHTFGDKSAESYRKEIRKFRKDCQKHLSSAS